MQTVNISVSVFLNATINLDDCYLDSNNSNMLTSPGTCGTNNFLARDLFGVRRNINITQRRFHEAVGSSQQMSSKNFKFFPALLNASIMLESEASPADQSETCFAVAKMINTSFFVSCCIIKFRTSGVFVNTCVISMV